VFFEIIGEIDDVETFAVGKSIRELPRLRKIYGDGPGGSAKGSQMSGFRMVLFGQWRFTGMKRQASAGKKSKSSGSWISYAGSSKRD
jgi:hypothetical protein